MPGIVGLITKKPSEWAAPQLLRMLRAIRHESFYTSGTWADDRSGVYVGWAERKNSFAEKMPVFSEKKDIVLAFSGEEFPEPGTARRLKQQGHVFELEGPSYLVHLYEDDPAFLAGLNGRFHGVIVDRNLETVLLFNDRYGMHRIYYHQTRDAFYFAGEAKAILTVCPELRRADARSLGEFIATGAVLENRTLFEGIQLLPPASAWCFRNGLLEKKDCFFHASEWEEQEELDQETYTTHLRNIFLRNLPRYYGGRDPVAMSLTGGLDSRMILANSATVPGALPCYTFGSMFRENRDVQIARRVANLCQQPHQVITAGKEFLSQFARYAERAIYLTDGCVDVGRAPDVYLSEKAREIAPVRMAGTYGGELLRAVRAFKAEEPTRGLFRPEFLSYIHQAQDTYRKAFVGHPVSLTAFKLCPWALQGILALEQTQLCVRAPFLDNEFVRMVFRSPLVALASNEVSLRLIRDGNPALLEIPTDRGLAGNLGRTSSVIYRGVLEFLFKAEYASDMGMPQWLAKLDHLSPLRVEHLFLGRHKVFHFRVWYRDALASYLREMLLDPRTLSRPYIVRAGLEAVVHGHLKGNRNHTNTLHKVLTLEILHRLFLDGGGVDGNRTAAAARLDQLATA